MFGTVQLWSAEAGARFELESLRPVLRRTAMAARAHFDAEAVEIVLHDGDDAYRCGQDGRLELILDAGSEQLFCAPVWSDSKSQNAELGLAHAAFVASAPVRFSAPPQRGRITVLGAPRPLDAALMEILADLADGVAESAHALSVTRTEAHSRAEAQAAEQILFNLMGAAPVAVAVTHRALRLMHASPRWCAGMGLGERDILGVALGDLLPDVVERGGERLTACLAGEPVKADQVRFQRADGQVVWARVEGAPWRDPEGEIGGRRPHWQGHS
nr:PAS domain-containing protein [Phenylobacterium sp.]